jgi:hypothetical protein
MNIDLNIAGAHLGHPADAAGHRGPDPGLHRRRGGDQPDPVGGHAARLDRSGGRVNLSDNHTNGGCRHRHRLMSWVHDHGHGDIYDHEFELCFNHNDVGILTCGPLQRSATTRIWRS